MIELRGGSFGSLNRRVYPGGQLASANAAAPGAPLQAGRLMRQHYSRAAKSCEKEMTMTLLYRLLENGGANYGRKPCHDFTNGRRLQIFRVPAGAMSREAAEERALAQLKRAPYMDDGGPAAAVTPARVQSAPKAVDESVARAPDATMPRAASVYREMNGQHDAEPLPRDADGLPNPDAVYLRLNPRRREGEPKAQGQERGAAVAPRRGFPDSVVSGVYQRWNGGDEAA